MNKHMFKGILVVVMLFVPACYGGSMDEGSAKAAKTGYGAKKQAQKKSVKKTSTKAEKSERKYFKHPKTREHAKIGEKSSRVTTHSMSAKARNKTTKAESKENEHNHRVAGGAHHTYVTEHMTVKHKSDE